MKLSNVKAMFGKVMAIGLVAGAVALVAPVKAEAQQFAVGVQYGPAYRYEGRHDFYERERIEREREAIARQEAWQRHEAWVRHERWERFHGEYYGAPRGYYGRY